MCDEPEELIRMPRPITIDELNALVKAGVIDSIEQFELVDIEDYLASNSNKLMREYARTSPRRRRK